MILPVHKSVATRVLINHEVAKISKHSLIRPYLHKPHTKEATKDKIRAMWWPCVYVQLVWVSCYGVWAEISDLCPKWVRLSENWTYPWFSDQISVHFEKAPNLSPVRLIWPMFGSNLTFLFELLLFVYFLLFNNGCLEYF